MKREWFTCCCADSRRHDVPIKWVDRDGLRVPDVVPDNCSRGHPVPREEAEEWLECMSMGTPGPVIHWIQPATAADLRWAILQPRGVREDRVLCPDLPGMTASELTDYLNFISRRNI